MRKPRTSLKLLKYMEPVETYRAGEVVFREGEHGKTMYLVKAGNVDLRILERTVETLEAGDILGEMALLDNEARSATAVAATDCQLVVIDNDKFLYLVRETPFFALEVMQIMAARLRRMNREKESSSQTAIIRKS
jgi:CRP-like cAMP-binding protein